MLTYRSNEEAARQVADEIEQLGQQAQLVQLQLEVAAAVATIADQAAARFGRLHSVVYAAGPPVHMQYINDLKPAH